MYRGSVWVNHKMELVCSKELAIHRTVGGSATQGMMG